MGKNKLLWFSLHLLTGTNLRLIKELKRKFISAENIFHSKKEELINAGLSEKKVKMIVSKEIINRAEEELNQIEKKGYHILSIEDENYPVLLKEIYDPPVVLYCAGDKEMLNQPSIAIVGTRRPTPYGRVVAEKLSSDLASRELTIISGLARGIDSIAHQGSLQAKGKTIAVLGSGLNYVYPKENLSLFNKIVESGAVISEFPLDAPPLNFHFPIRNRIISGLSLGVIVVEAAQRSGSLITARLALDQGREVMAVPGNITSKYSQGTNWLIKDGAKLISSWKDVVEELPLPVKEEIFSKEKKEEKVFPKLTSEEEKVLNALKLDEKIHIDSLSEITELSVSQLLSILLSLELEGLIIQYPGKYFQRKI
ncbi:MAG: DNA-processing protein DprA [Candidatus Aminicenantia bacterium]